MASGVEVETQPTAVMTEEYVVIGGGGVEPQVEVATEVPDVGGEELMTSLGPLHFLLSEIAESSIP